MDLPVTSEYYEQLCDLFGINGDEYPVLVELKAALYYNFDTSKYNLGYVPLNKVESLLFLSLINGDSNDFNYFIENNKDELDTIFAGEVCDHMTGIVIADNKIITVDHFRGMPGGNLNNVYISLGKDHTHFEFPDHSYISRLNIIVESSENYRAHYFKFPSTYKGKVVNVFSYGHERIKIYMQKASVEYVTVPTRTEVHDYADMTMLADQYK